MSTSYEVLVLGSGPAGYYSALSCARGGLSTAIVENSLWGGTGFATGCLPAKLKLDGIRSHTPLDLISDHIHEVSKKLQRQLKEAGVSVYHSEGIFTDRNSYKINDRILHAKKIIVATGSEPSCLKGSKFSEKIISHKEALTLKKVPDNILIVGGDVEGIEFASLFSQMGTKVTVVELLSQILPGYDRDLVGPVIRELQNRNVDILCSTEVQSLRDLASEITVVTNKGDISCDLVLVTGLRKNSLPRGLKELGVKIENDSIIVDDNFETSLQGIFAVGDINGILGMAGAAVQQAIQLGDYLLSGEQINLDYSILPRAVFSIPQISGGGLQEKDISSKYKVKKFQLNESWRAMYKQSHAGFVKIIVDADEVIRGIWFVGENAEVHGSSAALILKNKTTINDLRRDLYIHPTDFESVFEAGIL